MYLLTYLVPGVSDLFPPKLWVVWLVSMYASANLY